MKFRSLYALTPAQEAWVEQTLQSLSLREKIGQTAQERLYALAEGSLEQAAEYLERYPLGSLFCGGEIIKDAGSAAGVTRRGLEYCQRISRVPLLIAGDLENGAGCAVQGLSVFPHLMALGATDDEQLAYEYGRCTALEGRAAGFHWTYSPVVDLLRNWLNPVVSNRAIGADPARVARVARAVIQGMQDHGIAGCAKHFPGDGIDFRDQHLVTSINSLGRAEWQETFGAVFREVIAAGVYSIMPGHIALPWYEPFDARTEHPRPASVSRRQLTGLLRGELGFEGVIISDALEMAGFTGWAPYEQRIVEAFNAGVDIMLWPNKRYFEVMERALEEGAVTPERLEESVRRVLRLKAQLGLAEITADGCDPRALPLEGDRLPAPQHEECLHLARRVAERSLTLVRNRDHLLPLDAARVKHVLLHSATNPTSDRRTGATALLAEELRARGIEVTLLENGNCLDVWNLERQGGRWDAYLVVFDLQIHHAKNTVRPIGSMAEVMWTLQNTDTLKPIVISLGTPFLLWDMPFLKTLLNAYSPSAGSVHALVRALFGEIPCAGRSPVDVGGNWVPGSDEPAPAAAPTPPADLIEPDHSAPRAPLAGV